MARRVLCVGTGLAHHLPATYAHAFEELGWQASSFDLDAAVRANTRLGPVGARFNDYVPVEAWVRKANREFLLKALREKPDLVLVVGHASTRVGALSQLLAAMPDTKLVLVWPDTLLNLGRDELECLPLYDLVASYGRNSRGPLERLGARRTAWVPLAADPYLHNPAVLDKATQTQWKSEVLFVGSHRAERERSILALEDAGFRVTVWGGAPWRKNAKVPGRVASYWRGRELHGQELATASSCATVCVNLIDPTNFPAANMRFFENFLFDVATVNTACPEMVDIFRHEEHTLYAADDTELVASVRRLFADETLRRRIARAGRDLVLAEHTYVQRARQIADAVGLVG